MAFTTPGVSEDEKRKLAANDRQNPEKYEESGL
jgi:hypothetical protein